MCSYCLSTAQDQGQSRYHAYPWQQTQAGVCLTCLRSGKVCAVGTHRRSPVLTGPRKRGLTKRSASNVSSPLVVYTTAEKRASGKAPCTAFALKSLSTTSAVLIGNPRRTLAGPHGRFLLRWGQISLRHSLHILGLTERTAAGVVVTILVVSPTAFILDLRSASLGFHPYDGSARPEVQRATRLQPPKAVKLPSIRLPVRPHYHFGEMALMLPSSADVPNALPIH